MTSSQNTEANEHRRPLASMLEHTLLGDKLDEAQVRRHVEEAKGLGVFGVCLPLAFIPLAKKLIAGAPLKLVTVIDFPLGKKSAEEKAQEAVTARMLGADEIDMVIDYQALIARNYHKVLNDLVVVKRQAHPLPVKVIVETSALNREQLVIAITLVALSGVDFIKTSTGFHKAGAKVDDITLMAALLPDRVKIKASGGIRDRASALAMIEAGASRIGSSKSRDILENTR
jgi:deoxyribose-phosphate aldolase